MVQPEVIALRPTGWETDPDEERYKVSIIDLIPVCTYNHYLLFYRLEDQTKEHAITVLRAGLEKTLSQARHLAGTIEPDHEGGHSFVKRKESTVKLVTMRYDAEGDKWPSMDDIENAHFAQHALGDDLGKWGIPEMTWGERPEAELVNNPTTAGFQINLVRGGMVFTGRQLRGHFPGHPFPAWDPACIDASRFYKHLPEEQMVEGPPMPLRQPGHVEQQAVLFHLPQSKAAEIKRLASPTDPNAHWISTYDAMCAFMWRALSRVRAPLFKPDLARPLWWGCAVNMRPRLHRPPVPKRMMHNCLVGCFSDALPGVALPTAGDVVSNEVPLSRLAGCIRAMNAACTEDYLYGLLDLIAPVRDKRNISLRIDEKPPMSIFVTDHRPGDISGFDFGFGKPLTYRHMWGDLLTAGLILIYAPVQSGKAGADEGCMFTVTMEKELVPVLCADPEWSRYFEYRGVD
ncbi:acyltransferase [Apiospora phragmitis]|uniref:Acyltransferase n=1 Tax=Apiospora phragmitis TaxID=2905665 RepID=A0ABR1V0E3_9PEZI